MFGWIFNIIFQALNYCRSLSLLRSLSTDPSQQFSAPFKGGNSRQAQTCYISQEYNTKKTQGLTDSNSFRRNGTSHDLEAQRINVTMLAT
jgi:hypothetical protein